MDTMATVEKLPSCNRVASAALLNSCSGLDSSALTEAESDKGSDLLLGEAKAIYAARLAVCELLEANTEIPQACSTFVPTKKNTRKQGIRGFLTPNGVTAPVVHYLYYDEVTDRHLKQCSAALGSKPQWWTSYSNARQNAAVMCHAMRADVEKGE